MFRVILLAITALLSGACNLMGTDSSRAEWLGEGTRTFSVVETLDGTWRGGDLVFSAGGQGTIGVTAVDNWATTMVAEQPSAGIRMFLAFQLAKDRTREDFRNFKEIDLSWVSANNGTNQATVWTRRTNSWPFDGFDDTTFATREDFRVAYEGNEAILQAADGLFGERVLVVVVAEKR